MDLLIKNFLTNIKKSTGTNFLILLGGGVVFQTALLLMQSNQSISLSALVAMAINYCIQVCITYMVSGDILMVLFYNCTTTMVNFTAQTHLDYQEVGMLGIYNKALNENSGVLNLTAFDHLNSSIF